jgi:hypothetical protein
MNMGDLKFALAIACGITLGLIISKILWKLTVYIFNLPN